MNYTQNYQLNQWEQSDRVLMEDFNSDNQKIEAALAAVRLELAESVAACPVVKLMDITVQEATAQIDLNLEHIDLELYRTLIVELYPSVNSVQNTGICIKCNNLSDIYHQNDTSSVGLSDFNMGANVQASLMCAHIALMAGGLVGLPVHSYWNKVDKYHYVDCLDHACGTTAVNKSTLQSLNLVVLGSEKYLSSGTRIILRGVKL